MKQIADIYRRTGELHHGYLLEGEQEKVLKQLLEFFESELKIVTRGNPDVTIFKYTTFGIDDGRELKHRASQKAFSLSQRKIFVIAFQSITHEAQNSLLKLFEEPTPNTHFFLITATAEVFLPTLKSRLFIVSDTTQLKDDESTQFAKQFMKASKPTRIKLLKDIIDNKDKGKAISFLGELEEVLYCEKDLVSGGKRVYGLEQIEICRRYLYDRSPQVKMLLEHIALTV